MKIYVGMFYGKNVYVDNQDAADLINYLYRKIEADEKRHSEQLDTLIS